MSITYYVLVVLDISPQGFHEDLHGYILYSCYVCVKLIVCCDRNKVQFNSIQKSLLFSKYPVGEEFSCVVMHVR